MSSKAKTDDGSDYEAMRAANIKRNQEIMRALGLDSNDFKLHAEHSRKPAKKEATSTPKTSKKRSHDDEEGEASHHEPTRRSARQQGIAPDGTPVVLPDDEEGAAREGGGELHPTRAPWEAHEAAERDYLRWAGQQKTQTIVGTASYSHTLKRVRTMNEQALARRIRAIEKAKGRYAVVKMKLFAQVLLLEGYDELAAEATEAFKRLVEVLGEPEPDEQEGGEDGDD